MASSRSNTHRADRPSRSRFWGAGVVAVSGAAVMLALAVQPASAATAPGLGTAAFYTVLGAQTVTNVGPSLLPANLGLFPGEEAAVTGFADEEVQGETHAGDAEAQQAQADLGVAIGAAAAQASDASIGNDLGAGETLTPGVYTAGSSLLLTGTLTLDAEGDPNAVFIIRVPQSLTTATNSTVLLEGDAQACNVFWQIGASATLGTDSTFVGTIMAGVSISTDGGNTIEGRALAQTAAVTLIRTTFTAISCDTEEETSSSGDGSTSPTDGSTSPTDSSTSPTDSSTSPTDSSTSPTDSSTSPTDSSTSPTDSSTSPTDNSTTDDSTTDDSTTDDSTSTTGAGGGDGRGGDGSGTGGPSGVDGDGLTGDGTDTAGGGTDGSLTGSGGTDGSGSTTTALSRTGSDLDLPLLVSGSVLLLVLGAGLVLRRHRALRG